MINFEVEQATKNLFRIYEKNDVDVIDDWEVDKLIEWTNCLNFDE